LKKLLLIVFTLALVIALAACGSEENAGNNGTTGNNGENTENTGDTTGNTGGSAEETKGNGTLDKALEDGVITIAYAQEPPYSYMEDDELKGAAVEIAREVFKGIGIEKMEPKLTKWEQLIPGLKTGEFDAIVAGMAVKPDRCEQVDFGELEIKYGEGIVVQKGNPQDIHSYQDIADNSDVKVAVMSGATEYDFLLDAGVSEDQIQLAPSIAATLDLVKTGRADVTTATEMTVKKAMESVGGDDLEYVQDFVQPDVDGVPSYGAVAFNADADALREAYNAELQKLKDSGKIKEILSSDALPFWGEANLVDEGVTTEQLCQG